ncbi:hypothetical protein L1987_38841 [Smallanthus sonchifolius]|uniref:Uncharacterized protein n=1 Tax=Smallanthus sonchifolius TaxID=185202 RepID=A0ACB9HL30_9ASTR|nr:hypothetical protein L1987_38841 [Smallanthus sonchifolius]
MGSRPEAFNVEATPPPPAAPASAPPPPPPVEANHFPFSFTWYLVPVFIFLMYAVVVYFVLNSGGLQVTGVVNDFELYISTDETGVTLGATVDLSTTLKKTGSVELVPHSVAYNLTLTNRLGNPVSTFCSSPKFNISVNEMKLNFKPYKTLLRKEDLVLLKNQVQDEKAKVWLVLRIDYVWRVKKWKLELGLASYRHTRLTCIFPANGVSINFRGRKEVADFFGEFGEVTGVYIARKWDKNKKQFGFVSFRGFQDAKELEKRLKHIRMGRNTSIHPNFVWLIS